MSDHRTDGFNTDTTITRLAIAENEAVLAWQEAFLAWGDDPTDTNAATAMATMEALNAARLELVSARLEAEREKLRKRLDMYRTSGDLSERVAALRAAVSVTGTVQGEE